jgi:phosphotriesterase-related protein
MRAAVLAQQETGLSLTVHPGADPDQPLQIMASIIEWGGNAHRTIIGHLDRTIFDPDRLLRLAETGCVLEFDLFGYETAYWPLGPIIMPNDGDRLQLMRVLFEHGHGEQLVISHDICRLTRLLHYGGHGYGHIFRNVVPLMLREGFSVREKSLILEDTPRRLLTIPSSL